MQGVGGAVRHGVNLIVAHLLGLGFPWATLSINIIGSLLMGILTEIFVMRTGLPQELRLFLTTGILGGFTTFSTFSLDAVGLWERGEGLAPPSSTPALLSSWHSLQCSLAWRWCVVWLEVKRHEKYSSGWPFWALLSAGFAAMTAIFAKVGVENVNSDFATFIRTIVILAAAGMMVYVTGNWQSPGTVSGRSWSFPCSIGPGNRRVVDLLFPGVETR